MNGMQRGLEHTRIGIRSLLFTIIFLLGMSALEISAADEEIEKHGEELEHRNRIEFFLGNTHVEDEDAFHAHKQQQQELKSFYESQMDFKQQVKEYEKDCDRRDLVDLKNKHHNMHRYEQ